MRGQEQNTKTFRRLEAIMTQKELDLREVIGLRTRQLHESTLINYNDFDEEVEEILEEVPTPSAPTVRITRRGNGN